MIANNYHEVCTVGTTVCGYDSINFTTLQIYPNNNNTVQACLQNDGDLGIGRLGSYQKYL